MPEKEIIAVYGAREHNLQNIDVEIPRNKLVVFTGISGSGKSSLAFDTIYAEGQRRYIETFSAYARQFLGNLKRPDVDKISGLSPVISIEQKTVSRNPRSTVGTITEIYDFLRLLYARASTAYSKATGEKMVRFTEKQITEQILNECNDQKIIVLAPVIKGRKGHYRELFEQIRKKGFLKVRIDGEIKDINSVTRLDRYKVHDIEIVIDRLTATSNSSLRIAESVKLALIHGKGVLLLLNHDTGEIRHFSKFLMCPTTGIAYDEPAPNLFSFNSPYGACSHCNGLGKVTEADMDKIIPNKNLSIAAGAILPIGEIRSSILFRQIEAILKKNNYKLETPINEIDKNIIRLLLMGSDEEIIINNATGVIEKFVNFEGIVNFIIRHYKENPSATIKRWALGFMKKIQCPVCNGTRLKEDALFFKIDGKNIAELSGINILSLNLWFTDIESRISDRQNIIARDVLKEIRSRIKFILDVGLNYITLNRPAKSLSGGEAQRIRLATQIGSNLTGVLYILDEPSIGLHQRDNLKLITSLQQLRNHGNSVIVIEHDKEMIQSADYVIDVGPYAGIHGGKIIAQGEPYKLSSEFSTTAKYLSGELSIPVPKNRRKGNGKKLELLGASGNNLKSIDVSFPLGTFICVTGVSGSGKSTLINHTLYPILSNYFYRSVQVPLPYKKIIGINNIDKVIEINQAPIGRTPRSNPATYTGVFTEIRNLFTLTNEAKIRGYKPGRFSFNVKGGRCETCKGAGLRTIEMNFLPNVYVPCDTCQALRYNRETLEIRYKGKSINDVLNMTIEESCEFFKSIPAIYQKIHTLKTVGLGYITLGQPSTTLSGGEAQRIKLAAELSKRDTGNTFYILDEPTTGLHFEDIRVLLDVLNKLVQKGNTALIIEHNMDVIKTADRIIDLGHEGGEKGGNIIAVGTPESIAKSNIGYTSKFLADELLKKTT